MIAYILLEEALSIVTTNDWVRKLQILDDGLKFSLVLLCDLATEDHGDLVGLADRTVGIEQSLTKLIQCGPPVKDQVVTILHLREEKPMLTARFFAFAFLEERSQIGQLFLPAAQQIMGSQGICKLLKFLRMTAFEECIGTLLKIDAFSKHALSQPVVLVEAETR